MAGWPNHPQSPGSRPGLLCGRGSGVGVARGNRAGLASEREAGCQSCSARALLHRSPQRELGDCDVAYQLGTARLERRQDAVANVRRDGTGNPEPLLSRRPHRPKLPRLAARAHARPRHTPEPIPAGPYRRHDGELGNLRGMQETGISRYSFLINGTGKIFRS